MKSLTALEQEFLLGLIFKPAKVWMPNEYKPVLRRLNVWGRNVISDSQKDRMLAKPKFTTKGTTYYTGDHITELRMEH